MRLTSATLVLLLAACGDDSPGGKTGTDSGSDVLFPDVAMTTAPDTNESDTSALDTTADTSVAEDTMVADTTVSEDTTVADTSVVDTLEPDTTVADTVAPDTTVADTADTSEVTGPTCHTLPAGHQRHLVVARPYSEPDGDAADRWEVLPLLADGTLGKASDSFAMYRAGYGHVSFSADGALGAVATDDGRIGVFALSADGKATVIEFGLETDTYPSEVQIAGDRLFIVDGNWQNNGGGIYMASFGCDGTVGTPTLLYATKNAERLVRRADGTHLVAAKEAVDTTFGALHLVRPKSAFFERLATASPFDGDAILSSLGVTSDGRFALVGDNQFFSDTPNRVGVIELGSDTLTSVDVLTPIEDPFDIIVSPMNDAVLVVTGFADDVRVLDYDASRDTPFVDMGSVTYIDGVSPQLPGDAVLVGGAHPNLVFVAENQAIRRFLFAGNGHVVDLGWTATAPEESFELIPGAIGMQP